ncbi:MAG: PD40 domain-containing protein [Chloroflexi bacterium]|nr:PD40 domain-containing protein [Chloroflexota bacterium]
MHRIAALFVVMLLVLSGGGNLADPVPATPAPLLPIPGTPQPPDPLGGFRGIPSIPETDAPPLTLLSPAPQTEVYRGEIVFAWTPHPQAQSYRLSVLRDGEPYFAHTYAARHICTTDLCALATYLDSGIPGFDVDVPHTWSVEPRDANGDLFTGSRSTAAPSTFVPKRRPFVAPLPEIAPPDGMIGPRTVASKIVHLYRHGISWRYPDGSGPVYGTAEYTIASLSGCGSVAIGFCDLDYPALSPDLNRVAFVGRAALGNEQADTPDLYIASIDGTSIQRMTTTSAEETYLNWSPDGTQLAFSIWVSANNRYDLYVLSDLDTTPTVSFVIENAMYPSWSPNGTHISYVVEDELICDLRTLKWENGQVSDITLIALAPLNDGCYRDVDRSPAQHQYVYSSYAPTPGLRLIGVTNGIGSLPTPLADGWYTDPNWDPDGVAVAFGGQPIVGSGTTFPPSGAGLFVQRVATNGAPVGQPTTVATIALPPPDNGMRPDWNGTPVCTGARDAGGDLCQPAPTATISFATNTPLGPTPTPTPSPSPTVAPTLSDAQLATVFPLPMQPGAGTPEARLSNGEFVERGNPTALPVCSRDVNPPGFPVSYPLIIPANAELWVVDTEYLPSEAPNNANLGRFTVYRIRLQDLPAGTLERLKSSPSMQQNEFQTLLDEAINNPSTSVNLGWVYIAYAHQDSVTVVATPARHQYPPLQPTAEIGSSGNSGLTSVPTAEFHLDVSAYYVSGRVELPILSIAADEPHNGLKYFDPTFQDYFTLYKTLRTATRRNAYGLITLIDPITLWPQLGVDVGFPIYIDCFDYP